MSEDGTIELDDAMKADLLLTQHMVESDPNSFSRTEKALMRCAKAIYLYAIQLEVRIEDLEEKSGVN